MVMKPVQKNVGMPPSWEGMPRAGTVPLLCSVLQRLVNSVHVVGMLNLYLANGGFQ